jgi:hypothetical protein
LSNDDKEKIYDKLDEIDIAYAEMIRQQLNSGNPNKKDINNILQRRYVNNLTSGENNILRGGRRKRKTMKKRPQRTRKLRKLQKGGYTYSSSKELDKASSVISNSSSSRSRSRTNSGSKSKTIRNKKKSRRSSRK